MAIIEDNSEILAKKTELILTNEQLINLEIIINCCRIEKPKIFNENNFDMMTEITNLCGLIQDACEKKKLIIY